ncbi:hypothetical protein DACRYDRAFT_47218 [Dacryopinax primogenitus]|uniref:Phospholipase/carboxylesterase/thioesterase domain-containing protein n=1 Tax=Dacryopinax primogenitus (strain DJM 731) TaxID=1858805 RepID=M5GDP6_DACPD|nr:uncharacterized protein DACRYDRAFT_47218 [Dacryopinax primogenitus]EJU04692.1 hypothetical protein DACRYDRAFT_47218 [Dacryopinax primogenitus]
MSQPSTVTVHAPDRSPRRKRAPGKLPLKYSYAPSNDGTDENLLILLHGLGDTELPFANLGRSLKLPQTATLSLRAPLRIPFLEEDAFQWYPSFDPLGDLLTRPDPTGAVDVLLLTLKALVDDCHWPVNKIHLFGFAQGGSVAAELAVRVWQDRVFPSGGETVEPLALASVVTIGGPLLEHPTFTPACATPILVFHRLPPSASALPSSAVRAFERAFQEMKELKITGGEGMPRSREEWEPVMRFWAGVLGRRVPEDLLEVVAGGPV